MENFIRYYQFKDDFVCDKLIEYHKENTEYKKSNYHKEKNSTDVLVFNHSQNETVISFFNILTECIKSYIDEFKIGDSSTHFRTNDINIIKHYKPGESYFEWHSERNNMLQTRRQLAYMLYLNDVTDGGETIFKYQDVKLTPKKGLCTIWPSDFTHLHKGLTSKTQDKYIITGWVEYE